MEDIHLFPLEADKDNSEADGDHDKQEDSHDDSIELVTNRPVATIWIITLACFALC